MLARMFNRKEFLLLALMGGATTAAFAVGCTGGGKQTEGTAEVALTAEAAVAYQDKLFDASYVHQVEVTMDEEDWAELQAHPLNKTKYPAEVVIDGETFSDVKVSAKGSASLRSMVAKGTGRYSLKIGFPKDDPDASYYGLESFGLANNATDASMVKDYLAYEMFRKAGVPAALCSYSWVTVNGQPYGLFTSTENIGEGFLARNFQGEGKLYKPEAGATTTANLKSTEEIAAAVESGSKVPDHGFSWIGNLPELNDGADLRYTDDDLSSYADIFENAESDVDEADEQRVVAALKALSEGRIEQAVDVEQVIRYFAVSNLTCNYDSYIGHLDHNFYLYEKDGLLAMLPWDYDFYDSMMLTEDVPAELSLASRHEEVSIDEPLNVSEENRPMWTWITENEQYLETYHSYVEGCLKDCVDSKWIEDETQRVSEMIREYVEDDPTAVYTPEEFDEAVEKVRRFWIKRAAYVRG